MYTIVAVMDWSNGSSTKTTPIASQAVAVELAQFHYEYSGDIKFMGVWDIDRGLYVWQAAKELMVSPTPDEATELPFDDMIVAACTPEWMHYITGVYHESDPG